MSSVNYWKCPECDYAIQQNLIGTPHTSGISCLVCGSSLKGISEEKAKRIADARDEGGDEDAD